MNLTTKESSSRLQAITNFILNRRYVDTIDAVKESTPLSLIIKESFRLTGFNVNVKTSIEKVAGNRFKVNYRVSNN